ncbi:MAG TPA: hypothetical protein VH598_13630, partial [Verrucomicrobiae bacterium]|nr:hypothetical protein [Verrucomicrobiae bacterium]
RGNLSKALLFAPKGQPHTSLGQTSAAMMPVWKDSPQERRPKIYSPVPVWKDPPVRNAKNV